MARLEKAYDLLAPMHHAVERQIGVLERQEQQQREQQRDRGLERDVGISR